MQTGDKVMEKMLETFNERKARYGMNYLQLGHVMMTLFPDGLTLNTVDGWNRLHLFLQMMVKATRLANTNLTHEDSAHDASVYAAMLNGLLLPDEIKSELQCGGATIRPCCGTATNSDHHPKCADWLKA